jgi:hypothetical protein
LLKSAKPKTDIKAPNQPKKFVPFSYSDSRSIESTYQKLLEESEGNRNRPPSWSGYPPTQKIDSPGFVNAESITPTSHLGIDLSDSTAQVPVNEDFLFDVNIKTRELSPVYWLGPVYEVRRGSWFYYEGSSLRPCEENLAAQLEEVCKLRYKFTQSRCSY